MTVEPFVEELLMNPERMMAWNRCNISVKKKSELSSIQTKELTTAL